MRKGAATYSSSGSTSCPSATAIQLRAGWTLGGVQDRYLRYEAAGDMYVGRTVAGLNPNSSDFAILPPFFIERDTAVSDAISLCFPQCPDNLRRVAEFALASLVWHSTYLRTTMPAEHLIFETALFTTSGLTEILLPKVACRLPETGDPIVCTGIPPHVMILVAQKKAEDFFSNFDVKMQNVRQEIGRDLVQVLEDRALGMGTVTYTGLDERIQRSMSDAGLSDIIDFVRSLRTSPVEFLTQIQNQSSTQAVRRNDNSAPYYWNDRYNSLPEDYCLPKGTILIAWQHWCCGNGSIGILPLKDARPQDFHLTAERKKFSDFSYLMKRIQSSAQLNSLWVNSPSLQQANEIFDQVLPSLGLPTETTTGRVRRTAQMKWKSAVFELRRIARS